MAVPKVQSPDLDVLISRPTDQQGTVRGDVHTQHWQLVTIQGQEELEGVCEEELDGGVKQRHSYQLACRCVADKFAASAAQLWEVAFQSFIISHVGGPCGAYAKEWMHLRWLH